MNPEFRAVRPRRLRGLAWLRNATGTALAGGLLLVALAASADPPAVRSEAPASATASPPEMAIVPRPARPPEPADNPATPDKIALGRLLFFDPILSTTRRVACSTCHDPRWGWADGRPTPLGVGGEGVGPSRTFVGPGDPPRLERNTPSILDVAFNGLVAGAALSRVGVAAPMFWDARVVGLEAQALVPMRTLGEMRDESVAEDQAASEAVTRLRGIPEYRDRFRAAFGSSTTNLAEIITVDRLALALAAFERSLVSAPAPIDRFLAGESTALNDGQKRGLRVFQRSGCAACHGGPMFSDYKLHHVGVRDRTAGPTVEIRTPTLRNLRSTGPYFHDGSRRTVRDVLVFYDDLAESIAETLDGGATGGDVPLDPLLRRLDLDPADFPALEAFLDALNGIPPEFTP